MSFNPDFVDYLRKMGYFSKRPDDFGGGAGRIRAANAASTNIGRSGVGTKVGLT